MWTKNSPKESGFYWFDGFYFDRYNHKRETCEVVYIREYSIDAYTRYGKDPDNRFFVAYNLKSFTYPDELPPSCFHGLWHKVEKPA